MTTVYAFGDSVLRGVVLENSKYKISPKSFSNICENVLGISIENKAKFGSIANTVRNSMERNKEGLENTNYDYVVFEFGGNDCDFNWKEISENPKGEHEPNTTIEEFIAVYNQLIQKVKELGKQPVLLSLPPIDSEKYFKKISENLNSENILKWMEGNKQFITNWHERYNIEVFKLALNNNIAVIDITSKFLENKNYTKFLCDDGIHPNEEGHKIIASVINEDIKNKNIKL